MKRLSIVFMIFLFSLGLYVWMGYNHLTTGEEAVRQQWAQVMAIYERRLDLVEELSKTTKALSQTPSTGAALHALNIAQQGVLSLKKEKPYESQKALSHFEQAQKNLTSTLSQFFEVASKDPSLKENDVFLKEMATLKHTAHHIHLTRQRFNLTVNRFNGMLSQYPEKIFVMLGMVKPKFSFSNQNNSVLIFRF